jgi:hypothetical protein
MAITWSRCSWCNTENRTTVQWCRKCGHAAQKARLFCACEQCEQRGRFQHGMMTHEETKEALIEGADEEPRRCAWCNDALELNDDLLCGACSYKQAFLED